MWKFIMGLLWFLHAQPEVKEVEKAVVKRTIGLIDYLFDWVKLGEAPDPIVNEANARIKAMIDEFGEDDLIAYLQSRGVVVVPAPILPAPPQAP